MKMTAGLIGLGQIGLLFDMQHKSDFVLTHAKAYLKHKRFQLLFGVDRNRSRRTLFRKYTGCYAFDSLEKAHKHFPQVDIFSVCIAIDERKKLLRKILAFKPKALLWEKPLARNTKEAKEILRDCKRANTKICVNYLRRFERSAQLVKKEINSSRLGKIKAVHVFYNGGLYNNASHFIDFLVMIFGKPSGWKTIKKVRDNSDYHADFLLTFKNFNVQFHYVEADYPVGEIDFWLSNGKLAYRKFGLDIELLTTTRDPVFRSYLELNHSKKIKSRLPYAMTDVLTHVGSRINDNRAFLSNGKTSLETLKICEDIVKAR